ncbi:MAG: hypothetical protein WD136_00220 [Cyanobium sp.]
MLGTLVGSLLLAAQAPITTLSASAQGRQQPPLPQSRPTLYDPDLTTCEPERIRLAFQQQLQPFADEGDAVMARLRQVQLEMTANTLRRCVGRELLGRQQADQLFRELSASPSPSVLP